MSMDIRYIYIRFRLINFSISISLSFSLSLISALFGHRFKQQIYIYSVWKFQGFEFIFSIRLELFRFFSLFQVILLFIIGHSNRCFVFFFFFVVFVAAVIFCRFFIHMCVFFCSIIINKYKNFFSLVVIWPSSNWIE